MHCLTYQTLLTVLALSLVAPLANAAEPATPDPHANETPAQRDARTSAAREFHVAPGGSDADAGTQDKPFATVAGARDAIRVLRGKSGLPRGGVTVYLHGGGIPVRRAV
jgi:acetyl esterase/lipase